MGKMGASQRTSHGTREGSVRNHYHEISEAQFKLVLFTPAPSPSLALLPPAVRGSDNRERLITN